MFEKKYNAKVIEQSMQQFWEDEQIYRFDERSDKKIYSVDTPPPTVNGKIHIGHVYSFTHIDIVSRYKRMTGYNVFYPFGFDDNGLPTERLVERTINKKAHELPREEFVNYCLDQTKALEVKFKALFKAMGHSPDWRFEYSTISPKSQKIAQQSFLDLYNKKLVYFADAPALWCTECRTSIAQAELESKDLESTFNYIKFYLEGSDEYLEVATTRPELLPACVCLFINPEDKVRAKYLGKNVVVPLFNFTVPVMADEKALLDKGTGAVMCCTFGDQTDLEWYKKYKLPCKVAFDNSGCMNEIAGKYQGMYLLKARKAIIEDMKEAGLLFKQEALTHSVSLHERCGSPMEILNKKQWFIDLVNHKQEFIDAGNKIKWYPESMRYRYQNWVENIGWDWCISRQRYFGVPFPVWYCAKCGKVHVASPEELPVNPLTYTPAFKCECGCTELVPEQDIMDTWMTSSVTPLLTLNSLEDKALRESMFPMSLRPNAHDIIRTWDFYTIVKALYHFNTIPWDNAMISGFVMASKEEKISKRKDNAKMEPQNLLDNYSADVTRYWSASSSLGCDIIFSDDEFLKGAKLVTKIFNASKFVISFLTDYNPAIDCKLEPMDAWIIAKYNEMLYNYNRYMDGYELSLSMKALERFFWNFCDNYIEVVKNRLYKPEIYGEAGKLSGQKTCYLVLLNMLKCFAPFMPHISEYVYKEAFEAIEGSKTIHLLQLEEIKLPVAENAKTGGDEFITAMALVRKYKSEKGLSLKNELETVELTVTDEAFARAAENDFKAVNSIINLTVSKGEQLKLIINGETAE